MVIFLFAALAWPGRATAPTAPLSTESPTRLLAASHLLPDDHLGDDGLTIASQPDPEHDSDLDGYWSGGQLLPRMIVFEGVISRLAIGPSVQPPDRLFRPPRAVLL